jgi:hypothetical protein
MPEIFPRLQVRLKQDSTQEFTALLRRIEVDAAVAAEPLDLLILITGRDEQQ